MDRTAPTGADREVPGRPPGAGVAGAVHGFAEAALALPVDRRTDVQVLAAEATGACGACIYIADYAQQVLRPLQTETQESATPVDGSTLGGVFQSGESYVGEGRIAVALIDGRDRSASSSTATGTTRPARSSWPKPSVAP